MGSDKTIKANTDIIQISIHAPRVGSDLFSEKNMKVGCYFNPRSPCGERRSEFDYLRNALTFQSTLPVWGATRVVLAGGLNLLISIHAPRVGSDFCIIVIYN